jgi:RNA polymerase sigma-70 factor (ECF subfamily)
MPTDQAQFREWMDKASSGDDEAFASLVRALQDDLYRFALAQGFSRADAVETVQETFLRAYRGRRRWKAGGNAAAWFYGIMMNVTRERRREHRRLAEVGGIDPEILKAANNEQREADPDELAQIAAAVAQLPERQRDAVVCRFLRGMSVRETAAVMGCAEGTVRAAVFAALQNLRKALRAET